MPAYFFDASALVKRYVQENGSDWIRRLLVEQQPRVFISTLSGAEVASALMRKQRAGELAAEGWGRAMAVFRRDFTHDYIYIPPELPVITRAAEKEQTIVCREHTTENSPPDLTGLIAEG